MAIKLWLLICVSSLMLLPVTNGSSENITNSKRLFGSKMCAFLCRRTSGCSQFQFSDSTCVLNTIESSTEGGVMCTSNKVLTQDMGESQCCPKCYKIIYNKRRNTPCVASSTARSTDHVSTSLNLGTTESGHDHANKTFLRRLERRGGPVVKAHPTEDPASFSHMASTSGTTEHERASLNLGTTESGRDHARTKTFFRHSGRRSSPLVKAHPIPVAPASARRRHQIAQDNLNRACRVGDLSKVKLILSEGGVDINFFKSWQKSPVTVAARWGHRDVVVFLVNEGADLSLVDQFHNNVLHGACIGGDVKIVNYLLSLDVLDINCKGHNRKTPLMLAAIHKHSRVVEALLLEGADMSPVDYSGNNVLHCACLGGNVMIVKHLLSRGRADIYARNLGGKTAADLARDKGFGSISNLLASFGVYK